MKILNLHLSHLRKDEHFQFGADFSGLVYKRMAVKAKIAPQFAEYLLSLLLNAGNAPNPILISSPAFTVGTGTRGGGRKDHHDNRLRYRIILRRGGRPLHRAEDKRNA